MTACLRGGTRKISDSKDVRSEKKKEDARKRQQRHRDKLKMLKGDFEVNHDQMFVQGHDEVLT